MPDENTIEVDLSNVDGLAEKVARHLENGDEGVDVAIPHVIIDPFGDQIQELGEYLQERGVAESKKIAELDIKIQYNDPSVRVTHVKEVDE